MVWLGYYLFYLATLTLLMSTFIKAQNIKINKLSVLKLNRNTTYSKTTNTFKISVKVSFSDKVFLYFASLAH